MDVLSIHEHHVLVAKSPPSARLIDRGVAEPQVVGGLAEGQFDELLVSKSRWTCTVRCSSVKLWTLYMTPLSTLRLVRRPPITSRPFQTHMSCG